MPHSIRTPGRMPLAPAVGAATMRPMEELTSQTAIALAAARQVLTPENGSNFANRNSRRASPPDRWDTVSTCSSSPIRTASRMTSRFSRISARMESRIISPRETSRRIIASAIVQFSAVQYLQSAAPFLNASINCIPAPPYTANSSVIPVQSWRMIACISFVTGVSVSMHI